MRTACLTILIIAGLLASDVQAADPEVVYPARINPDGSLTYLHLVVRHTKGDRLRAQH